MLAVEAMNRHTADAGAQLQWGLAEAGYTLCGYQLPIDMVQVPLILETLRPGIVVVQDKREWEGHTARQLTASYCKQMRFQAIEALIRRKDVFKLTVLKDAHGRPAYHRQSALEIDCHAWIIYYHPQIVKHVAPYVRIKDCIRTYHSVNSRDVPAYTDRGRGECILSGAFSAYYPLRVKVLKNLIHLPLVTVKRHPGYRATGCATPQYLKVLSCFKVAICTSSRLGYSLRKIIEATACGCRVITDLPTDDVMPAIDENLVRVSPSINVLHLKKLIEDLVNGYDPTFQREMAGRACDWYDYRIVGKRLTTAIEEAREQWKDE